MRFAQFERVSFRNWKYSYGFFGVWDSNVAARNWTFGSYLCCIPPGMFCTPAKMLQGGYRITHIETFFRMKILIKKLTHMMNIQHPKSGSKYFARVRVWRHLLMRIVVWERYAALNNSAVLVGWTVVIRVM